MTRGISYAPWTLVGVVPYNYIYSIFIDIYKMCGILSIIITMLSILITFIIHKSIANPIQDLVNKMSNVDEDKLGSEMVVSGNDEISFIIIRGL